jgi:hypothetical protein
MSANHSFSNVRRRALLLSGALLPISAPAIAQQMSSPNNSGCLPSHGVRRPIKEHLDLGVIYLGRVVRHPATRLEVEILEIVTGSLAARFLT